MHPSRPAALRSKERCQGSHGFFTTTTTDRSGGAAAAQRRPLRARSSEPSAPVCSRRYRHTVVGTDIRGRVSASEPLSRNTNTGCPFGPHGAIRYDAATTRQGTLRRSRRSLHARRLPVVPAKAATGPTPKPPSATTFAPPSGSPFAMVTMTMARTMPPLPPRSIRRARSRYSSTARRVSGSSRAIEYASTTTACRMP